MSFDYIKSFWEKVNKTGSCWEWVASKTTHGYGQFWIEKTKWSSHRLAYTLIKGDIPKGLQLDHLCRNRGCVNPDHLEPVTNRENTVRGLVVNSKKHPYPVGVYRPRGQNTFAVRKKFNNRQYYIGYFPTAESASVVYQTAVLIDL